MKGSGLGSIKMGKVLNNGLMVQGMRGFLELIKLMASERCCIPMEIFILENLPMIWQTAMVFLFMRQELNTMENGKMINIMEKVKKSRLISLSI